MFTWAFGAICLVATLYVTAARVVPIRVIFGYALTIDLLFTALMFSLFHGTMTGLMSSTVASLVLAVSLTVGRWCFGYQRVVFKRNRRTITVELQTTPGRLQEFYRTCQAKMTHVMTGLTENFGG